MVPMLAGELSCAILGSKIACSSGQGTCCLALKHFIVTITYATVWHIFYFTVRVSLSHAVMDAMLSDDMKRLISVNHHFVCAVTCPCSYQMYGNCKDTLW